MFGWYGLAANKIMQESETTLNMVKKGKRNVNT